LAGVFIWLLIFIFLCCYSFKKLRYTCKFSVTCCFIKRTIDEIRQWMMNDDNFKNIKSCCLVLTFYSLVLALGFWFLTIKFNQEFQGLKACKDVIKVLY